MNNSFGKEFIYAIIVTAVLIGCFSYVNAPTIAISPEETIPETTCVSGGIRYSPEAVPLESGEGTEPAIETEPVLETVPTEPTPTEPPAPLRAYYDVPLDRDLQDHIFEVCERYGIDPDVVMAMIRMESTYNPECIGPGGAAIGLMQIIPKWHWDRMERLNCMDLLDPYQNVVVGVDYLAELYRYYGSMSSALMAYNGGYRYADEKIAAGEISSYASTILYWAGQY